MKSFFLAFNKLQQFPSFKIHLIENFHLFHFLFIVFNLGCNTKRSNSVKVAFYILRLKDMFSLFLLTFNAAHYISFEGTGDVLDKFTLKHY